jgi:hypothetical protein
MNWLHGENRDAVHVCKTRRLGVSKKHEIFPALWKKQKSFQTECFALWSDIARKFQWWGNRGGDHQYTVKITRKYPISWHDLIVTQAQAGKGHGERLDADGKPHVRDSLNPRDSVFVKMFATIKGRKQAQLIEMSAIEAEAIEKHGLGRITFKGVTVA